MVFLAREKEVQKLKSALEKPDYELILVYGRRHVGKTELIKHTCGLSELPVVYYMCRQINEKKLTDELTAAIDNVFPLEGQMFRSFEDALRFMYKKGQKEPAVLVLDEYPNARREIEGLDTMLQSLSDEYKGHTKLKVILSGSYIDVMKSLKGSDEPLYGRITLSIDLKQMDYFDSARFYPSFKDTEKVELYSVFGGVPLYNSLIRSDLSVKENIINLIASPDARLSDEIDSFLKTGLSKIANANSVFDAMATGEINYSEIQKKANIESTGVMNDLIHKLIGMEVVRKEYPINKENDRSKSHYYINDNFSRFYYRYIARRISQMSIMDPDVFFDRFIKPDFEEHYVPKSFEEICKQFLIRKNITGDINPVIEKIGKYYYDDVANHTNGEFDIVTYDEKGYSFYEAKYKSRPVTDGTVQKEIQQVQTTNLNCYQYGFFSKSGFADNVSDTLIKFTLKDIYKS